jgi:hypothetical protein
LQVNYDNTKKDSIVFVLLRLEFYNFQEEMGLLGVDMLRFYAELAGEESERDLEWILLNYFSKVKIVMVLMC